MKNAFKKFWKQLTCDHDWNYDGNTQDKQGNSHSHIEKCFWCKKRREMPNDSNCSCRYFDTSI